MKEPAEKPPARSDSGARPMQVDAFAILTVVMATLLVLSQGFLLVWLDLL